MVEVRGDRLFTRSILSRRDLSAQQIKNVQMVTVIRHRRARKSLVQIQLDGDRFTLSGFPEGNEMLYGAVKNWWESCQSSAAPQG